MPKVKELDAKAGAYREKIGAWDSLELLSSGGYALLGMASRFLPQRSREAADVYAERLRNATYNNVLGSVAGWYQAALLKNRPALMVVQDGAAVEEKGWWGAFERDVDRGGTSLPAFGGKLLGDLIVFGEAWVQVDLPRTETEFTSRAEQMAAGVFDAFLTRYDPRQVINWSEDAAGRLEWVVVKATTEVRSFMGAAVTVDRWYYFDRTVYRVFEAERKDGKPSDEAREVGNGRHAMAEAGEVPIRRFRVSEELWLGNRVYPQLLEHFRTENGLNWSLENACYPVPYIKGDFEGNVVPSVVTYLSLPADGEFGYAETSGLSFQAAADRCGTLREDIYRGCYLQAQGRSSSSTPAAQSGYSKELDMTPANDVLGRYGVAVRDALEGLLVAIASIRGEEVSFALSGFEFDDSAATEAVEHFETVEDAGIDSETLRRVLAKRVARAMLAGEDPAVIGTVEREIDTAPTAAEKAASEMASKAALVRSSLGVTGK